MGGNFIFLWCYDKLNFDKIIYITYEYRKFWNGFVQLTFINKLFSQKYDIINS